MANEILSKGVKVSMDSKELTGITKLPDLSKGTPDKVEVTNLKDGQKRYINGILDVGDSLEFEANYESEVDGTFKTLCEAEEDGASHKFDIEFVDGLKFSFNGQVSVTLNGAGVGEAMAYKFAVTPNTEITRTLRAE